MAPSAPRCMRPLVPFFLPGSLDRNDALEPELPKNTAASTVPPTTVAVRTWDRATGVFKHPQQISVTDTVYTPKAPPSPPSSPAQMSQSNFSDSAHISNKDYAFVDTVQAAAAKLLTPASILAQRTIDECTSIQRHTRDSVQQPDPASSNDELENKSDTTRGDSRAFKKNENSTEQEFQTDPKSPTCASERHRTRGKVISVKFNGDRSPHRRVRADGRTTPVRKPPKRRAVSCSPLQKPHPIDVPANAAVVAASTAFKYAGSSFDAASPAPVSLPIPQLAVRRHSYSDSLAEDAAIIRRMLRI